MVDIQAEILSKLKAKYFKELLQKKHREEQGKFLVEGIRLCKELLSSNLAIEAVIFTDKLQSTPQGQEILEESVKKRIPLLKTTDELLQKLSDTCCPQPVIMCASMRQHSLNDEFFKGHRFLALFNLSDPGNIGTLLRTAEAFSWDGVLFLDDTVEVYNPKIVRASMGSIFRLSIACSTLETAMSFFEYTHVPYFITMPRQGTMPSPDSLPSKMVLLLGNEAHGLPQFLVDKASGSIQIPMRPNVESLNVAVAGGILLFSLRYPVSGIEKE